MSPVADIDICRMDFRGGLDSKTMRRRALAFSFSKSNNAWLMEDSQRSRSSCSYDPKTRVSLWYVVESSEFIDFLMCLILNRYGWWLGFDDDDNDDGDETEQSERFSGTITAESKVMTVDGVGEAAVQ